MTHGAKWTAAVAAGKRIIRGRTVMVRTWRKRDTPAFGWVPPMLGAREKLQWGQRPCPYQDLTQVPLAEKA
jgi:hypothetical protein